jgi:ribokinase
MLCFHKERCHNMEKRPKIAVIGSNMIDLITNVRRMPRRGETVDAPSFDMGFGGKGANQAVAASKLGADVVMVTKVGGDMFGRAVKRNFESFGIDTTFVESVEGVSNGVAPIFVDDSGDNYILIVKGANFFLKKEDIDRASGLLSKCDLILLQLEIPVESVYHAIDLGYRNSIPVVLNPAPARKLDFAHIRKADFLIPNETELEILTGMPVKTEGQVEKAAKALLKKGVKTVIITLGERGSMLVQKDGTQRVPAVKVETKDTTGAGDAYIGSLAYYLVSTRNLAESMECANLYAALSTLKTGTQKAFVEKDELEKHLHRNR